jgi:GDP-4-dehydro-6-deoxy-D-mannose reductase
MSKILVTGVNGFVGAHLIRELVQNGNEVVGVGGPIGNAGTPESLRAYLQLDLNSKEAAQTIDFTDIDGVIHLAGLAAVGPSFDDPMLYINTNIGIESNLFEAALAQGAKPRFLIISSGALYDPRADLPLTETSRVLPSSPYAVSKLGQEELAKYYTSRGLECIIARPFNHIGPGQMGGFIVPDLAMQVVAVEQGKSSEISVGNLDSERDYTDVRDIARAYRLLLEKGKSEQTYNICTGKSVSGHAILDALMSLSPSRPAVTANQDLMRPSDNPIIFGSHDKLTADTGWQPEISLDTTLSDVVSEWRKR